MNQMNSFEQQFNKIKSGTTEEKVRSILGEPDESLFPKPYTVTGKKVLWPISKKWIYERDGVSYILYFHKINSWVVNSKSKIKNQTS